MRFGTWIHSHGTRHVVALAQSGSRGRGVECNGCLCLGWVGPRGVNTQFVNQCVGRKRRIGAIIVERLYGGQDDVLRTNLEIVAKRCSIFTEAEAISAQD